MNWFDALGDDAKKAFLALDDDVKNVIATVAYASKIPWDAGIRSIGEALSNPTTPPSNLTVQNIMKVVAGGMKIGGLFDPPLAIVANDIDAAEILEPTVAALAKFLIALNGGKIPQVTTDLEQTIDQRFGTGDAPTMGNE